MGRLDGKVAIISGGARGQGEAEARLIAAEGGKVIIGDVLDKEGEAVAASIGQDALYRHLDVTQQEDWQNAVATSQTVFGRVDVLVNNAGIIKGGNIVEQTLEDFMQVVNVNQVGTWLGMKVVAPAMRDGGAGGSIVNISATAGLVGLQGSSAYSATKFAVRGMTRSAAVEFAPWAIRVNTVLPGPVESAMTRRPGEDEHDYGVELGVPLRRMATPEEIARLVLFLASDESSYCTGAEFLIDGGMLAGTHWHPVTE